MYLIELDRQDEVEKSHEKTQLEGKTEFDKAELIQMFYLLQKLFYIKIQIQKPILKSSMNSLKLFES